MPAPPTGTVTFLFTDIEGSTRRWDQQSEAMKGALARHDAILRSGIEAHGGHVFKTVGDGFYAAFATAPDAFAAALEAQRALAAESWGEVGELRVRMALHTGAVQHRDGDYFGQAPNRVSRLLNTGHGGQTLLSLATQELVRDQVPEGVQLRDLGSHRLRDLIRPEEIFQVVAPPLQVDFPPLKTLDARPHNLQTQPTPLIGREREVEQVCTQIRREQVRLLTLTGPGGTGKTRLALQIAADLLDDYKDGVYFVALAPLSDPSLVVSTIAQALGVKESGGRSILQSLQDYLREKSLLLALDNFEQVTAAAPQVAELLANCSTLNVLVTSRIPLHVRGEHEFPVPPLALPNIKHLPALDVLSQYAAVELFIQRAQAVKPDFAVNNDNAPAVAEICVRLDGLPLAIELAAVRVKILSPQAMLVRLEEPLKLLTGGARDLSARQQTLRGAIAWSYDLLDGNEKRLFRRLAVFVGGFTLEAAAAVCDANGDLQIDVLEGIADLVDENLLRQEPSHDDEPRFFMLETIREYALERLTESGGKEECQQRHLDFFLGFAERGEIELCGAQQLNWLDRLETEYDNLRAALDWSTQDEGTIQLGLRLAGAMSRFWSIRGHFTEGRERLLHLLESPGASSRTAERAKALSGSGSLLSFSNQIEAQRLALRCLEESVAIWRELGDKRGLALALTYLSLVTYRRVDRPAALALAEESVALAQESDEKWLSALSMAHLGHLTFWQGDLLRGRSLTERSIATYRQIGDRAGLAFALDTLGWLLFNGGDATAGRKLIEESLALNRELGDDWWAAEKLEDLAGMAFLQGDYSSARKFYEADLAIHTRLGNKTDIALSLFWLGYYTRDEGGETAALGLYDQCLAMARESRNQDVVAQLLYYVGIAALDDDEYERARALLDESVAILEELHDKEFTPWPLMGLGDLAWLNGEESEARGFYEKSVAAARVSENENTTSFVLRQMGGVAFDHCDFARARLLWEERFAIYRQSNYRLGSAASLLCFGRLAHYCADYPQAIALFEESMPIFRELGQERYVSLSLCGIAAVAHVKGDFRRARDLFEKGIATFRRLPGLHLLEKPMGDLVSSLGSLSRVASVQGDFDTALMVLKESMSISKHTRNKRGIAECLAGFAKVAQAQGDVGRAARLLGAAESLHKIVGPRLSPLDHHDRASVIAMLRSALGDEAFTTAWAEGRAMTQDHAAAYALEAAEVS